MTAPHNDLDQFGRRVVDHLDAAPLTPYQTERLRRARLAALAAAHAPAPSKPAAEPRRRWALGFVLALIVGTAVFWTGGESDHPDDEIDAMLLADELPPDVYLDDQLMQMAQES